MTDTHTGTNFPPIQLPNLSQIESFVESADSVLALFSGNPQIAFVQKIVVPILEGALKVGGHLQSGGDPSQVGPLIAAEFHNIANAIHPSA